ncbi:LysM peptidoglycan-binding domain-containing protein [Enterococcus faecium]|uniref:LysM peptidoglycan-binding domain-containing protein n=1 Tax=Enterococcus faecium TaxID=1352 RepID=A0A9X3XT34_ENTFC|nr:LysM peptidoglycan-binding domain-containing protein [Enterococcus faecium]MDC4248082.1 LysM peptidoglycan-binding domain-containing protein [Enterococcus faecium]
MKKFMASLVVGAAFGVVFVQGVNAHASEADGVWTPRTVDQIKADIAKAKDNKYTIVWGDTLSGISAATNLTVQKLADMNKIANVDLIYAGNTLIFEGNVVSVQDKENKTIAQTVIQPQDKVDAKKPVGKQEETKQAAEKTKATTAKTKETAEKQANDQATKPSDTSAEKTTQSTQPTDVQTGTSTTDNGTTSTQGGTSASTGSVETPAQPSAPAEQSGTQTPSQPSTGGNTGGSTTQPSTPAQPSTGGNTGATQGGTTQPAQPTQPSQSDSGNGGTASSGYYVGQVLESKSFPTTAEADAYMWEISDKWIEYGNKNNLTLDISWAGGGPYTVKVVVEAVN